MADAIVLKKLTKTFGETVAIRDLDLVVPRGGLYGVIGPNGAGKTTTIRMILSILFPDRGELTVLGKRSALEAKDRIGYLPEERGLYKKMRVGDFLTYIARLKGDNESNLKRRVTDWLERVGMSAVESKRCEELSKGMQQKIQFVAAVIHKPDLLVLDEPFAGLDPVNQRLLRSLVLEEHRRGATVLFSTHIMVHAEQLCDHVVMIHKGEKMLDETIAGIRTRFDPRSILFEPLDPSADLAPLNSVEGVVGTALDGSVCTIALEEQADPARVIPLLAAAVAPARIELKRPSLEEIFVTIVEHEKPAADEERLRLRASLQENEQILEARQ
jgi:ABC-2 type transport system ATP-binding protein